MAARILAMLVLVAVGVGTLSLVIGMFAEHPPAGMAWCPLSKKYQPITSSRAVLPRPPLDDLCVSTARKKEFVERFARYTSPPYPRPPTSQIHKLAFEYFSKGEVAFIGAAFPDREREDRASFSNHLAAAGFGGTQHHTKSIALLAGIRPIGLNPRPPTISVVFNIHHLVLPARIFLSPNLFSRPPPASA